MLRDITVKAEKIMEEFDDWVLEMKETWHKKMEELDKVHETEPMKLSWAIKIRNKFFLTHGI